MSYSENENNIDFANNNKTACCFCPSFASISDNGISKWDYQEMLNEWLEVDLPNFFSNDAIEKDRICEFDSQKLMTALPFQSKQ